MKQDMGRPNQPLLMCFLGKVNFCNARHGKLRGRSCKAEQRKDTNQDSHYHNVVKDYIRGKGRIPKSYWMFDMRPLASKNCLHIKYAP